jgi:hypothetical protein
MAAKTAPGGSEPSEKNLISMKIAREGESASEGTTEQSDQVAPNHTIMPPVEPSTVVPQDEETAHITTAQRTACSAASETTGATVLNAKPETRKSGPANSAALVNPPTVTQSDVTAPATGVEGAFSAPIHGVDIPQSRGSKNSESPNAMLPAMKSGQSSEGPKTVNETTARPGAESVESLPSKPAKSIVKSAMVPSSFQDREAAASSVPANNGTGPTAILEAASSNPGASHLYQHVDLGAVAQTFTPNHAASSSACADVQLLATNVLDATGVRGLHVVPSGPAQLDVGVLDGTHGWLRIRAELGTGGAVSASLTASALAHEPLKASLSEMVKYLGSESISVTALTVHRFAESADRMSAEVATSQQNGDTGGHDSSSDTTNHDAGNRKPEHAPDDSPATHSTPTSTSGIVDDDGYAGGRGSEGMQRIPGGTTWQSWPFGVLEGMNGSWLNVCA